MQMYLVMGITGRVGGATARHLLAEGAQVRALVRDSRKATAWEDRGVELREGDWNDAEAIARALTGVAGAFVMLPTTFTPTPDFAESRAVIAAYMDALLNVPPPRLVALSSIGAEKTSGLGMVTPLHLMEQSFRTLACPVAFVRAGAFYENFLHGLQTAKTGNLPVFYPKRMDEKFPMVATEDIGRCNACLLTEKPWSGRRVIELGTPTSADELAAQLADVVGRDVEARALPRREWAATLEGMGLPHAQTQAAEDMFDAVNSGWITFGVPEAERIEGVVTGRDVFIAAREQH